MKQGKKKRNLYKTALNWGIPYVILSILAIIFLGISANRYAQILRSDMEYTGGVHLENTKAQIDSNVHDLRILSNNMMSNKTVKSVDQAESYSQVPRYDLYQLVREMSNEHLADEVSNDYYLYFPNVDLLVSNTRYNTSRNYYNILFADSGFSYDDWYNIISRSYSTTQICALPRSNGDSLIVIVRPLDSSERKTSSVNAIMIMDLKDLMTASDWMDPDRDTIAIVNRNTHTLVSNTQIGESMTGRLMEYSLSSTSGTLQGQTQIDQKVVMIISSQYENWNYLVVTGAQEYYAKLQNLQLLVTILILLYLIASATIISRAVIRDYLPLKKAVDSMEKEGAGQNISSSNVYDYINSSVNKLLDEQRDSSNLIRSQREAISGEILHRLLVERDAASLVSEEQMRQCGLGDLEGRVGCILAYRFTVEPDTAAEDAELIRFILMNVTNENLINEGLQCVSFPENAGELIFLVTAEQSHNLLRKIKHAAAQTHAFTDSHFGLSYNIAISRKHPESGWIYRAYKEAVAVFENQRYQDGKVICYGDINLLAANTLLRYPIEAENRIAHAVQEGNEEKACAEIERLLHDNSANCLSPEATQYLVSNIAASVTRAAGHKGKTDIPVSQQLLMDAYRHGDVIKMQEELETMTRKVCRKMADEQKQETMDKGEMLYRQTKDYIEENYADDGLTVNSIAEVIGVPANYLSKLFKEYENEKLSSYIHKIRLTHVKEALAGDEKLEEIAARCGYGSFRTFLRIFKQYEGVTPTQYRELEEKEAVRK